MPGRNSAQVEQHFGFTVWLKAAGVFVLGALALLIFMWIFLSAIYAWGFFAAMLLLAGVALLIGWLGYRRSADEEGSF